MMKIDNPFPFFTDRDGLPLNTGSIYIGKQNLDARANPIDVFWDKEFSVPATQPLSTSGGYISRNGAPTAIYTREALYSVWIEGQGQVPLSNAPSVSDDDFVITPNDFGAAAGGSASVNTASFNRWIDFLNTEATASGFIPPGNYDVGGNLDPFTRAVKISGCGFSSIVRFTSTTAKGFAFLGSGSVLCDLQIRHINADGNDVPNHVSGYLIKFDSAADQNRGSSMTNVLVQGGFRQLDIHNCTGFKLDHCLMFDPKTSGNNICYAMHIANSRSKDTGDNFLTNNVFACKSANFSTNRIGIEHISGGGLYLTGNKFLHFRNHYRLAFDTAAFTSIFNASNNSFESATEASLTFQSSAASNGFEAVTISGNHFGSNRVDILFAQNTKKPRWISAINIIGNNSTKADVSIRIYSGFNVSVKHNLITGNGGSAGIDISAAVDDVRLGGNKISGMSVPYALASTNTVIERYPMVVSGSVTIAGTWGTSSLPFGTATINLPAAFPGGIANANIRVEITGRGTGHGISGFVDQITTGSQTQFSIVVLGAQAGSVAYRVVAEGY